MLYHNIIFQLMYHCLFNLLVKCVDSDLDIVLAISLAVDSSNKWSQVKNWAKDIVNLQEVSSTRTRISIITLSHRVNIQFQLNRYDNKNDIFNAIDSIG